MSRFDRDTQLVHTGWSIARLTKACSISIRARTLKYSLKWLTSRQVQSFSHLCPFSHLYALKQRLSPISSGRTPSSYRGGRKWTPTGGQSSMPIDRLQESQNRWGPKVCGYPPRYVAPWNRFPLDHHGDQSLDNKDTSIPPRRKRCPCRDGGVGEIDRGFAIPHQGKRVFNIDPPTFSNAIMQGAETLLRREQ